VRLAAAQSLADLHSAQIETSRDIEKLLYISQETNFEQFFDERGDMLLSLLDQIMGEA
jgi:hypothetical protein